MKVRWLPEAVDDLEDISDYLIVRSTYAADLVIRSIYDGLMSLGDFPHKGHPYGEPGTLRLLFPGLSYQATYRVVGNSVEILRISHTFGHASFSPPPPQSTDPSAHPFSTTNLTRELSTNRIPAHAAQLPARAVGERAPCVTASGHLK